MTIKEARKLGIKRLRKPQWNPLAYLLLPEHGVWAEIHDPAGVDSPIHVPLWNLGDDDDWLTFRWQLTYSLA